MVEEDRLDVWVMRFAASREQAVARVVMVFGIEASVAGRLVDSVPVAVKRRLEPSDALEFRRALEDIGAEVVVVPPGDAPPQPEAPPEEPAGPADLSALPLPDFDADQPAPESSPGQSLPSPPLTSLPPPMSPVPHTGSSAPSLLGRFSRAGTKIFLRFAAALLVSLGIYASIGWFDGDDEVRVFEDVDALCEWELTQPHSEARRWVNGRGHVVMGLRDPAAAVGFVNQLYQAGAVEVSVTRLQGSAMQQMSGTFVVELPATNADAVTATAVRAIEFDGTHLPIAEDGYAESGTRYLRVVFAEPMEDPGGNPWELEAELREASRARERGYHGEE